MEIDVTRLIDDKLEKQAKQLSVIENEAVEVVETKDSVYYNDYSNSEHSVSHTNMMTITVDDVPTLTLTRIIFSHVYRVEFDCTTLCCDIVPWFEVSDKIFMRASRR